LDLVYIFKYHGISEERIISTIDDYGKGLDRKEVKAS